MNNNSFYGGRDGRPMIITKKYSTVQEMLKDFSGLEEIKSFEEERNPSAGNRPYATELGVAFGDYVIIETENRNNPENGRIFRRGLDFNNIKNDDAISGWVFNKDTKMYEEKDFPSYGAKLVSQIVGPAGDAPHFQPVPFVDEEGITQTLDSIKQEYEAYDIMSGEGIFNVAFGNLVPGKDKAGNFIDDITWKHCSVRDTNAETSTAYIGFTFPYTVIEFEAQSESPYYNRNKGTANFINTDLITRHDEDKNAEHPFYQKWQIHIPKGIKGDSIEELELNDSTGVITYNIRNFNTDAEGQPTLYKLNENFPLTWITRANIDPATGAFNIDTNNNKNEISTTLQWLKNIDINPEDGAVTVSFTGGKEDEIKPSLQWVKDITIDETGKMTTDYTNQNDRVETNKFTWISEANIDGNKDLEIIFNNDNIDNINVSLKTPNTVNLKDGQFIATYNNGDETVLGMTEIGTSACAGAKVDPNLNVGGVWFVTQEM